MFSVHAVPSCAVQIWDHAMHNKNIITKRLWSFIKNKRQDNVGVSTLKHEGRTYVDATEKANLLADYFSSVFTNEDVSNIPTLSTSPIPSISSIRVYM